MTFNIISVVPEALESYLNSSIIGRAIGTKKIKVKILNPRDFTKDKHHKADERPYGGGPGMVLKAEPILKAVARLSTKHEARNSKQIKNLKLKIKKIKTIIFSPGGKLFTNELAAKWAKQYDELIMISGRYEGIDGRVKKILKAEEISVGPYVLTGGELPALIVLDTVTRKLPGVLGKDESVEERRVASGEVYTRPEILDYKKKKYRVPKVLLSGHHKNIDGWRGERKSI